MPIKEIYLRKFLLSYVAKSKAHMFCNYSQLKFPLNLKHVFPLAF